MVQEALADFSAAHFGNSSLIVPGVGGGDLALRDLQTREAALRTHVSYRDEILHATKRGYHENSLFVSHLLWKIRETVGPASMDEILKPLIDNLNSYHSSYDGLIQAEGRTSKDEAVKFSQDLEYVMAVLQETAKTMKDKESAPAITDAVATEVIDLKMSIPRIRYVAICLQPAVANAFVRTPTTLDLVQGIVLKTYAVGGFAIDLSVLYFIHQIF